MTPALFNRDSSKSRVVKKGYHPALADYHEAAAKLVESKFIVPHDHPSTQASPRHKGNSAAR